MLKYGVFIVTYASIACSGSVRTSEKQQANLSTSVKLDVNHSDVKTREIEARYPAIGEMIDVGGYRLHGVHVPRPATADLPPLVLP